MITIPKTNRFFCLIITILLLLIYANSFQNSFQYDDFHVIVKNPSIKDPGNFSNFFFDPQMGSGLIKETSSYRPLLMATFALNYFIGGLDVFSYHLLNFFLHTLCSFFVFFITLFFLRTTYGEKEFNLTRHQFTALFASLIFAVHPVQTESVTYITGRSSLLMALFFLAAFWTYTRYVLNGSVYHLFLSSISFICALLVKETAITLIMVLILFNLFFPLARTWKRRLFSLFPYFILSAIYLMMRVHFFGSLKYGSQPIRPIYDNLLTQIRAWVYSLGTLVLPLNLNVDYDFPISRSILEGEVLFSIFVLTAIALVIWKIAKSYRPVGFFALWFVVNLAPTSSIIPLEDVITDRWLYLPSVGFAVIMAFAAEWIFRVKVSMSTRVVKMVFFFLCALVVELYGFEVILRNFTWRSYWTLWEDAVEKSPNKCKPHLGLGIALNQAGYSDEAIKEFKRAAVLNPRGGEAYLNLGYVYYSQGKLEESIQANKKAIVLSPRLSPEAHNNLGMAYLHQGRKEEALHELQRALEIRPLYARPYLNLGNIYEKEGNIDKAIPLVEKAVKLEPELLPAHEALIRFYELKGWKEKRQGAYKNYLKYASRGKHFF